VIVRLIGKWLNAGVMQDGVVTYAEEGTPQGGSISPVLSNLYLHFVLDLWFEKKIKPQCRGEAYLVRFADGTPVQTSNLWGASPLIPIVRSGI
jgi:retron-type reverse transcriptase